jgi:hypothetical protein
MCIGSARKTGAEAADKNPEDWAKVLTNLPIDVSIRTIH